MMNYWNIFIFLFLISCSVRKSDPKPSAGIIQLAQIRVGTQILNFNGTNSSAPIDQPILADFSGVLDTASVSSGVTLIQNGAVVSSKISYLNNFQTFSLKPSQNLVNNLIYQLKISNAIKGKKSESFAGYTINFTTIPATLSLVSIKLDGVDVTTQNQVTNISLRPVCELTFSAPVNPQTATPTNLFISGKNPGSVTISLSNQNKTITLTTSNKLNQLDRYMLGVLADLNGANGEIFKSYSKTFYTQPDTTPKFPVVSDDQLLTIIQQQTFKYFYNFAEPASGMARERDTSGDLVTTGGSGFGLMALIVGIQHGFISRPAGIAQFDKIISFLETADRFHGAWPHWLSGTTGKIIPFNANDDGADLVETSFMVQGLLTVRQYLTSSDTLGNNLINRINTLWKEVEYDWFRQNNQQVLYWHWSPDKGWIMNFPINGYDEALIVYILAASSSVHTIPSSVYQQGWALNGNIKNGKSFYGHALPLGQDYGGPLFFAHYSFLGFNPSTQDTYANYWTQNVNHTMINHDYCVANPNHYVGYADNCWGLTASDNSSGYGAQSPTNDNGTISPTAAISSLPYAPVQSMKAIKFFYYTLGDRLWGQYGFYDAFNVTNGWTASSYLAIDQGPIVVMIENYRTQLLWNLFMSCPEVQAGKTKLGFN